MSGWIGFDLDGTLAKHGSWQGPNHIGEPIPEMIERVRGYLRRRIEVRIVTARASTGDPATIAAIEHWCISCIGQVLPITCSKDYQMLCLFDDRAIAVETNTGRILGGEIP